LGEEEASWAADFSQQRCHGHTTEVVGHIGSELKTVLTGEYEQGEE
jgi:hypothetical protein